MTTSRIASTFAQLHAAHKKALIPYITSGHPTPAYTVDIMHAIANAGADIIELGVPFSDPMADGPTIQSSNEKALSFGVGLRDVLSYVAQFRQTNLSTPIVLMGYANPIERMGLTEFALKAKAAGVDGVLVVDYPPEESVEFSALLRSHGMDPIFMLAPTSTDQRISDVAKLCTGYIYYVSLNGITGAANLDLSQVQGRVAKIRQSTGLPIGVGFGIRDAATASAIAQWADAVVIGSKLIQEIESVPAAQGAGHAAAFIANIRGAMDRTTIQETV
jgi:tryptophan synthase alpha chain